MCSYSGALHSVHITWLWSLKKGVLHLYAQDKQAIIMQMLTLYSLGLILWLHVLGYCTQIPLIIILMVNCSKWTSAYVIMIYFLYLYHSMQHSLNTFFLNRCTVSTRARLIELQVTWYATKFISHRPKIYIILYIHILKYSF